MKKVFCLILISFAFFGCQVEPVDPSLRANLPVNGIVASQILGSWDLEDQEITTVSTTTVLGNPISITSVTSLVSTNGVLTFNSDETFRTTGTSTLETSVGGVSAGNQSLPINGSGRYLVNGNRLEFPSSANNSGFQFNTDATYTIETLNATTLRIAINSNIEDTNNGVVTRNTISGFYLFARQ